MLNFIVCEDNDDYLINNCQIVNTIMMNSNTDYKISRFKGYDSNFKTVINEDGPKVYILDLELPTRSGLDIAREIRETDFYSQIIISSAHDELAPRAFKSRLMILDFISKFDNHNEKLKEAIEFALTTLNKRNVIKIGSKNNVFLIDTNDILYIIKENAEEKCTIKTKTNILTLNSSLLNLENKLQNQMIHTHRSCLINPNLVSKIDYKNEVITFKNGDNIKNMISRNYKKDLQKLWI